MCCFYSALRPAQAAFISTVLAMGLHLATQSFAALAGSSAIQVRGACMFVYIHTCIHGHACVNMCMHIHNCFTYNRYVC
jgi:hypothetical protein